MEQELHSIEEGVWLLAFAVAALGCALVEQELRSIEESVWWLAFSVAALGSALVALQNCAFLC